MAGIYFVILYCGHQFPCSSTNLCAMAAFFFFMPVILVVSGADWVTCFHPLSYRRDVHTTAPECQKQSPMSTDLTCPLEHHQQHTQDPPCAFSMCKCVASFSRLVLSVTATPTLLPPPASPCLPSSLFHCPLCVGNPASSSLVTCSPM